MAPVEDGNAGPSRARRHVSPTTVVAALVGAIDLVVALAWFVAGSGEGLSGIPVPAAVVFAVWWALPMGALALTRSTTGCAVIGAAALGGGVVALRRIYHSASSTAALGLLVIPVGRAAVVLALVAVERALAAYRGRDGRPARSRDRRP